MADALQHEIDAYLESNWEGVLADIAALVEVESVEDLAAAREGAPYGPGPREALDRALGIARRMGLDAHDCEGHIGYADLPGGEGAQIGIIGHVDVVPAGPGWTFPPYAVTRKDGYLVGRGVIDDKGPIVTALHAVKFWKDRGARLPYTVRVLFGANEETNMKDVEYYRQRYADPDFLFTPDAEFPVCYGEAGICSGHIVSAPLKGGALKAVQGGVAVNAVPGVAHALLSDAWGGEALPAEGVAVEEAGGGTALTATGQSAHASTPERGVNAIDVLAAYLLDAGGLSEGETAFLQLVRRVTSRSDGAGLGVQAEDAHFGSLTAVGGMIALEGGRMSLSIDFRYPTTTTAAAIEAQVKAVAAEYGATFRMEHDKGPFLMDRDSPAVRALLDAYNDATGESAEPFTMKGGTYARVFSTGVSFGPEKPWEAKPAWVGGMHGPDEGVREDLLKQAFAIYVRTIGNLMELDLA